MKGNDVIESEKTQEMDEEIGGSLLRPLIESSPAKTPQPAPLVDPTSVVIGELIGMKEEDHIPLVNFLGSPTKAPIPALSAIQFVTDDVGTQVALLFEGGDLNKPLIIGKIQKIQNFVKESPQDLIKQTTVELDGEAVVISAKKELILKCGKSSITLTAAGKLLIKGEYLSSRSTGVNRIKGGSIQLN